ncbi:tripartite tricarboxylate transporter substrate binding protein [Azospirillum sp. YIM B02556]|uniref:Tripartite tricarboxylate transporter substrate binding protein n=1 Tax=Azospirillum endophyticum TaxID=2800326 RepID=A0ABS1F8Q7_9PROT|nr:tripartite tricarboxylate transporter substrate binding protein [Azospirillum endophyticum]MBK1839791.1 tripartite tricarboxylate transporter substrate binding protein [Azospirillum endophyticum]
MTFATAVRFAALRPFALAGTVFAGALLGTPAASPAQPVPQDWPAKPVRIMVGANPGGGSDTIARLLGDHFSAATGQPFVIENRPGASNTIASDVTAKADKDGHTLLVAASTSVSIAPHLIKLGYDTLRDIQPVGLIALVPNVLVVNKDLGIDTVAQLVEHMKKNPGKVKYGSSGFGSTHVILAEQFNLAAGVKSVHVPYKGAAQTQIDIIAGQIQMTFDTVPAALGQIKAGNLKPLAVTSPTRIPELPDVPTIAESGYPAVETQVMYALYTTAGTPRPVVEKINALLNAALGEKTVNRRLVEFGALLQPMTVDAFDGFNRSEYERFGLLIRRAGIKAGS